MVEGKAWTPLCYGLAQGRAGMVPLLLAHAKKNKPEAAGGARCRERGREVRDLPAGTSWRQGRPGLRCFAASRFVLPAWVLCTPLLLLSPACATVQHHVLPVSLQRDLCAPQSWLST